MLNFKNGFDFFPVKTGDGLPPEIFCLMMFKIIYSDISNLKPAKSPMFPHPSRHQISPA